MTFKPTTLFKDVECPLGVACECLNCIFRHTDQTVKQEVPTHHNLPSQQPNVGSPARLSNDVEQRPLKRRRVDLEGDKSSLRSKADDLRAEVAKSRHTGTQVQASNTIGPHVKPTTSTATRPVSPPRKSKASSPAMQKLESGESESLNPRLLKSAPETHGKRTILLQYLHADMTRLNRSIRDAKSPIEDVDVTQLKRYVLSDQALIKLALTEEEEIARSSPAVYSNVIRNRVATYRRMTPEGWLQKLKKTIFLTVDEPKAKDEPKNAAINRAVASLEKLSPEGMASRYGLLKISTQELHSLGQFGYILEPPSEAAIEASRRSVEASQNHELCDRCGSRFRVYHDRDPETGRLTSNGPCHYHWGRKVYGSRQKTDAYTGKGDALYKCCGQEVGTPGCTEHEEHVYKVSSADRLGAVMQFIRTPIDTNPRRSPNGEQVTGVVFDCEMGYTTNGMELIRLTALRFLDKEPLLDVLVRPSGAVIDLNTRFSGVKPEHFSTATPYSRDAKPGTLQVVPDAATARKLLCEYLSGDTVPLMGHAIDNDLNAVRLCHHSLVDTVILYPHRRGLPMRMGLKVLTKMHLGRDIQMGGSEGHDSHEDAAATHDLVVMKLIQDNLIDQETPSENMAPGSQVMPVQASSL